MDAASAIGSLEGSLAGDENCDEVGDLPDLDLEHLHASAAQAAPAQREECSRPSGLSNLVRLTGLTADDLFPDDYDDDGGIAPGVAVAAATAAVAESLGGLFSLADLDDDAQAHNDDDDDDDDGIPPGVAVAAATAAVAESFGGLFSLADLDDDAAHANAHADDDDDDDDDDDREVDDEDGAVRGISRNVDALLDEFASLASLSWSSFRAAWSASRFASVHHVAATCAPRHWPATERAATARELQRMVYDDLLGRVLLASPPRPLVARAGVVYALMLAFRTQTLEPPELVEVSAAALRAGLQTASEARLAGCADVARCLGLLLKRRCFLFEAAALKTAAAALSACTTATATVTATATATVTATVTAAAWQPRVELPGELLPRMPAPTWDFLRGPPLLVPRHESIPLIGRTRAQQAQKPQPRKKRKRDRRSSKGKGKASAKGKAPAKTKSKVSKKKKAKVGATASATATATATAKGDDAKTSSKKKVRTDNDGSQGAEEGAPFANQNDKDREEEENEEEEEEEMVQQSTTADNAEVLEILFGAGAESESESSDDDDDDDDDDDGIVFQERPAATPSTTVSSTQ